MDLGKPPRIGDENFDRWTRDLYEWLKYPALKAHTLQVGDISGGNYLNIAADGSPIYLGTAALPHGCQHLHEGAVTIGINAVGQGTYVKITGLTTGHLNDVTVSSDAFNVSNIGKYMVSWAVSGDSDGINKDYHVDIFLNGVEQAEGSARMVFGGAHALGSMAASGVIDVTDTSHDIDIRMKEEGSGAGTDIVLYHVSFNIVQIAGT